MTGIERISNILKRKATDRIGVFEHFWDDTKKSYVEKGFMKEDELFEEHFGLDMSMNWTFNLVAKIDYQPKIIEETDETMLIIDGNGATLRRHKLHNSTPEHVDYIVKTLSEWEEYKPLLTNNVLIFN